MKRTLRQLMRAHRERLPAMVRSEASASICKQLLGLSEYQRSRHIGLYHAYRGEVDVKAVQLQACIEGKTSYYPAINPDLTLSFFPVFDNTAWKTNRFGIAEPDDKASEAIQLNQLDLLIMPLLAFDQHGTRLGSGAGYYDRTLAETKPTYLIGVAYEFQRQDFILAEKWDIPLSLIVTEKTIYRIKK